MTKDEFERVLMEYLVAFPSTARWLAELDDKTKNSTGVSKNGMLRTWWKCLEPLAAIHVTTAIDRMIMGQLNYVEAYERDKTALILRGYAGRIADDERKRTALAREREEFKKSKAKATPYPVGRMYSKLRELKDRGYDNKTAARMAEEFFEKELRDVEEQQSIDQPASKTENAGYIWNDHNLR